MSRLELDMPPAIWIDDEHDAHDLFLEWQKEPLIALDTETTGLNLSADQIVFWSVALGDPPAKGDFRHPGPSKRWALSRYVLPIFEPLFRDRERVLVGHNYYMFDYHMFRNSGIVTIADIHDTLVMTGLPGHAAWQHSNSLKACVRNRFLRHMPTFREVFGKVTMEEIESAGEEHELFSDLVDYASRDAWETLQLYYFLQGELDGWYCDLTDREGEANPAPRRTLWDHFLEYEVPFSKVLAEIVYRGIMIDVGFLGDLRPEITTRMTEIHTDFVAAAGSDINLNSPQQLRGFFFDHLGREPIKLTKGGQSGNRQPSTDSEVLEIWAGRGDEAAQQILEYRKLSKLRGTYIDGMVKRVDEDLRLHTRFIQGGTVTGRLASRDPNLQNLPIRSKEGRRIREAFIPSFDMVLLDADFSQLELRIIASFSNDQNMIGAFLAKRDLHCFTISLVDGLPYEEVMAAVNRGNGKCPHCGEQISNGKPGTYNCPKGHLGIRVTAKDVSMVERRRELKAVGFGILYGLGPVGLGKDLHLPILQRTSRRTGRTFDYCPDGEKLIGQYFNAYPEIPAWIEWIHAVCKQDGFVQSFLGNYRWIPEIHALQRGLQNRGKREAQNSPIQSTAADICKAAMLRCAESRELTEGYGFRMLLQIHDEILGELPEGGDTVGATQLLKELMEDPFQGRWSPYELRVPLIVEVGMGHSWATAH